MGKRRRSCGSCTACCTVLGVEELGKPDFSDCIHQLDGGCGIYTRKPKSCTDYRCLWLMGLLPDRDHRPDQLGVVFSASSSDLLGTYFQVSECVPDAIYQPEVEEIVFVLSEHHAVLWIEKETRTLLGGPPGTVEKLQRAVAEAQEG